MNLNLKTRIMNALSIPESDFSKHASDLYVIDQTGKVRAWLKDNYEFFNNVTTFSGSGPWKGKRCLDIPFAA